MLLSISIYIILTEFILFISLVTDISYLKAFQNNFKNSANQNFSKNTIPRKPFDNYLTPIEATPCKAYSGKMETIKAKTIRFKEKNT